MWTDADRETLRDRRRRYTSNLTDAQWASVAALLAGYDPLTANLREMVKPVGTVHHPFGILKV